MLSKVGKTLRSFVVGPDAEKKSERAKDSRKRHRDEYELDSLGEGATPTKRLRQGDCQQPNTSWYHIGKVAEWIVRQKKTFSESYYFRKVAENASPKVLLRQISRMATGQAPQSSGDIRNYPHRMDLNTGATNSAFQGMEPCSRSYVPNMSNHNPVAASQLPTGGAGAGPGTGSGAPRQPKTGYVDLPYPFVFPPDVIWTQDGQFKIPPTKPMDQRGNRPPLRMDHRSRPPMASSPLCSSTPCQPQTNLFKPVYDKVYHRTYSQVSSESRSQSCSKLAAREIIRLEEKNRYARLLQQFTNVPVSGMAFTSAHVPSERRTRISNLHQKTPLGSTIHKLSDSQAFESPELSRIEVMPRQTRSPDVTEVIDLTERSYHERSYHGLQRPINKPQPKAEQKSKVHFEDSMPTSSHKRFMTQPQTSRTLINGSGGPSGTFMDLSTSPPIIDLDSSHSPPVVILDSPTSSPEDLEISPGSRFPRCQDFEKSLRECKYTEEWLKDVTGNFSEESRKRDRQIQEEELKTKIFDEKREEWEQQLEDRIRHRLRLSEREKGVCEYSYEESEEEEEEEEEESEEDEFPGLDTEQEDMIDNALTPYPPNQVIAEGFRLQIRRCDMETLNGLNWLNDEVVNFYFELIRERGKLDNLPSVHIFNTFFYPKLKSQGQHGVRRWTKQVDIYTFDYIAIPIHLGMHWCLAVVDFRRKAIKYYDSMGGRNMECLNILRKYLQDECMQKKGQPYDTSDWSLENVTGLPQQMNGSDCGVFTCKYAEYVTRDSPVTFTQVNMPYFRRRMVLEILTKQLL